MKNVERDMKKALSDFKPDTGLQAQLAKAHHLTKEGAFALIRFIDTIVSIPGWIGKYHQAMEETDGDMHASIRAADSAINMAIGSGLPFDATAIMRHKYLSMFAFFFSFAVHQQESMAVAAEARRYGAISTMDYIHSRLLLWIFPSIGTTMMYYVLVNGGAGDEEKRKDLLKSLMIDLMSYRTMGLPFTRDIVTALSRGIKGERSVATAKVPTIEGFTILLRSAFATGRAISQWDEKSINMLILAICESISLWSNVPFTQVYKRIQKGLEAMRRGEGWAGSLFIPPKQ